MKKKIISNSYPCFPSAEAKINFFKEICLNFLQNRNTNKKLTLGSYAKASKTVTGGFFWVGAWYNMVWYLKAALRASNDVFLLAEFLVKMFSRKNISERYSRNDKNARVFGL